MIILVLTQRRWLDPLLFLWDNIINVELLGQLFPDTFLVVIYIIWVDISVFLRWSNVTFHLWCTDGIVKLRIEILL